MKRTINRAAALLLAFMLALSLLPAGALAAEVPRAAAMTGDDLQQLYDGAANGASIQLSGTINLDRPLIFEQSKAVSFMKELSALRLIWEKRCGRGDANQIYLAKVEGHACHAGSAPFVDAESEAASRSAGTESLEEGATPCGEALSEKCGASRNAGTALLVPEEVPDGHLKKCGCGPSGAAETELLQVRKRYPSYTYPSYTNGSAIEVSLSPRPTPAQDEATLTFILEECHLELFDPELARVFRSAIEQLFYTDSLRVGQAVLPQARVRSRLWDLDYTILQVAEGKLHQNKDHGVKNSVAYTMIVIFNAITEAESDAHVDPYLNAMRGEGVVP